VKKKIVGFGLVLAVIVAAITITHHGEFLLLSLPLLGNLTARTASTGSMQPKRIASFAFSDATGGANPVTITQLGEKSSYTSDADTSNTMYGPRQVTEKHKIIMFWPDPQVANSNVLANQLVTLIIPWVQVTYMNGTTVTLDSGNSAVPIMNFTKKWAEDGEAVGWQLDGVGIKSVEA
jgi:hypothetical protein